MAGVIDLGKLRATNQRLYHAVEHGMGLGVQEILTDAVRLAHDTKAVKNRTGQLRSGWYFQLMRRSGGFKGRLGNKVPYAFFQERGTGIFGPHRSKYEIRARDGGYLRFLGRDGQWVFRKFVWHPGVRANWIGFSAMYGREAPYLGMSHDRNIKHLVNSIDRELARVK